MAGLEGTVTTPFGKVQKKTAAMVAGGGVLIGGIVYYRYQQQQKADAAAASVTDAGANTGIDPATGYPYGSAEDAAALGNQGDYVSPEDSSSWVGGQVIGYDQYGNPIYGSGATNYPVGTAPGSFASNAQWASYVEDQLSNTVGTDATKVSSAIGKYLAGRELTSAELDIVNQATAIGGQPPVADASGYPPNYRLVPTPTTPGGGGGQAINPVKGLKVTPRYTEADVHWNNVTGATSYWVTLYDGGRQVHQYTVTGLNYTLRNLKEKHQYRVTVWARPSSKGSTASHTFRTK